MIFPTKLIKGKLVKRYKRFLTDVELEDGSIVIAHCTNSGSMKSCIEVGAPVYLSRAAKSQKENKIYMGNDLYKWRLDWYKYHDS